MPRTTAWRSRFAGRPADAISGPRGRRSRGWGRLARFARTSPCACAEWRLDQRPAGRGSGYPADQLDPASNSGCRWRRRVRRSTAVAALVGVTPLRCGSRPASSSSRFAKPTRKWLRRLQRPACTGSAAPVQQQQVAEVASSAAARLRSQTAAPPAPVIVAEAAPPPVAMPFVEVQPRKARRRQ